MAQLLKSFSILIFLSVFISCVSPLDVDTDRMGTAIKLQPSIVNITLTENGVKTPYIINKNSAYVDITLEPPVFWLEMNLKNLQYSALDAIPRITTNEINIKIDSVFIDSQNHFLSETDSEPNDMQISLLLRRDTRREFDTTIFCGSDGQNASVDIAYSQEDSLITFNFETMVYAKRTWYEYRDTIITDPNGLKLRHEIKTYKEAPDSLHIVGSMEFKHE
jgi:hypothetical protein